MKTMASEFERKRDLGLCTDVRCTNNSEVVRRDHYGDLEYLCKPCDHKRFMAEVDREKARERY